MLDKIIFGEGQKVMKIDLETLEKSADYRNPNAKKFPSSHFDIISDVTEMLESRKIPFEVDDVFITEKGTIPGTQKQVERMNKKILEDNPKATDENLVHVNDTETTIINEVIGSIKVLGDFNNDDMGLVIGFNQNEKGLVFGIGVHVKICSNFTIMGANDIFKNYGKDSIPYESMLEIIERRIDNIDSFWKEQGDFIKMLMTIKVDAILERNNIIGELLILAIKSAYIESTYEAPLNIGEVSKLAQNIYDLEPGLISAWELLNYITEITSKSTKLEARILQSGATGKYFFERYRLGETIDVVNLSDTIEKESEKESDADEAKTIIKDDKDY